MKKIVLATTALVSVAYAGSALAQESMVMFPQGADASIGGFYEFGYQSYTDDDETGMTRVLTLEAMVIPSFSSSSHAPPITA